MERLYELLANTFRVFLDSRCLLLGNDWDTELARAQQRSLVTVVLVFPNTPGTYYQREEVAAAVALARKAHDRRGVVPIYLGVAGSHPLKIMLAGCSSGLFLSSFESAIIINPTCRCVQNVSFKK